METRIHSAVESHPSVIGLDEESNYRTPSVLAIVSLILGLAAPLALFAPLVLLIPIAGALVALMAIRQIIASDGALFGRAAANIGLALSIAAIAAAFARTALTEQFLSRQARATADQWFDLLRAGDVQQAYDLTVGSRQAPPKAPPGSHEAETEPQVSPIETFRADPVVHFLLEHAQGKPVAYVRDEVVDPAAIFNARVQQLYEVTVPTEGSNSPTTSIELILQRTRGIGVSPNEWLVAAYSSRDLPPAAANDPHAGHVH
ncbi:MAG: hypothetical protein AB7G28_05705 [Pirellulales bacterium]